MKRRVTVLVLTALALVAGALPVYCSPRSPVVDTPGTPEATATTAARTPTKSPASVTGRNVLSNGTRGYSYVPQIAWINESNQVMLGNGDGSTSMKLMDGCTGIGSAKQGDLITGGLEWSADGSRLACWRTDLSVLAVKADGTEGGMPFKAGECERGPRWSPAGDLIACDSRGYLTIREPSGSAYATIREDIAGAWAWSPSGTALIVAGAPQGNRGTWRVYRSDGILVTEITDAYVASPTGFGWTLDGTRLAYPGTRGITVLNLSPGGHARIFHAPTGSTLDLTSGPIVEFILGDSAVLAHNFSGAAAIDIVLGAALSFANIPIEAFAVSRVAPDGALMAFVQKGIGGQVIGLADLRAGTMMTIPGSDYLLQGIGPSPQFQFSGDTKRLCWTPRPQDQPQVSCADIGSAAARLGVPMLVEPAVLGRGDPSVLWESVSPDLTRVAYTEPGTGVPGSSQQLRVAYRDGTGVAQIGATFGPLAYSWRPDGVYRPPARG